MNDVLTDEVILQLAGGVLALVIAGAAEAARRMFGLEVSRQRREELHGALLRGLQLGLSRQLTGSALLDVAVEYAATFSPGAVAAAQKATAKTGGKLQDVAGALLPGVIGGAK